MEQKYQTVLILVLIVVIGAGLRLHHLGTKSYWLDEELSIQAARMSVSQIVTNEDEPHPPLYYLLLHYWIKWWGEGETATRMLSAIFGVLSIGMLYLVGEALFNTKTGLLCAFIVSLSTFHIMHSQEVRMYSLLALTSLLSMYFYVRLLKTPTIFLSSGYLISTVFLLYTHVHGLFVIAVQLIAVYFWRERKLSILRLFLLQSIIILFYLPWAQMIFQEFLNDSLHTIGWLTKPTLFSLLETFFVFVFYNPVTLCLYGYFVVRLYQKKDIPTERIYLLIWLVMPIALPLMISYLVTPLYFPRYTISASLALYILVAHAVESFYEQRRFAVVVSVITVLFLSSSVAYFYFIPENEPWKEAVHTIEANANSQDSVVVLQEFAVHNYHRYSVRDDLQLYLGRKTIPSTKRIWILERTVRRGMFDRRAWDPFVPNQYSLVQTRKFGDLVVSLVEK